MKPMSLLATTFLAASSLAGTVALSPALAAAPSPALAQAERLVFRCTLAGTSHSYSVVEKGGRISLDGAPFRTIKVEKDIDGQGDARTYVFVGVAVVDGYARPLALRIGTDANPDAVIKPQGEVACQWKATVNSAVLDALVEATKDEGEKALDEALKQGDALKLCYDGGKFGDVPPEAEYGYGRSYARFDLGNHQWLVQVYCSLGAYQGDYQMVHVNLNTRDVSIAKVEAYNATLGRIDVTDVLFGLPGETDKGGLSNLSKRRGLGDCGEISSYAPFKGDVLRLEEVRSKGACDGVFVEPSEWPLVFKK